MSDLRETIRRIKESADIVAIVSRHTQLQRVGGRWKGLCPFHSEKTPSFHVRPETGSFHCFGCHAGGSVVDFVMKTERLEFMEAIEKLAKETNIPLPKMSSARREDRDAEEKLRRDVEQANRRALEFFSRALATRANPRANDYLPQRGLDQAMVDRFQLGAAPDQWSALLDHMKREGYEEGFLATAGLIVRNAENGRVYDRFRDRLVFPIIDHNGHVVGFGGRALQDDGKTPKYLNSAETPVYRKSRFLYALNVAAKAIQESGHAILCEGYMDVITCHAFGFPQAVASLGTALTADQARLLRRYTQRVFFLYDGDAPGVKAMMEGGLALLAAGLDTRVIELPPEHDPDTYLRDAGPDALRERIRTAREFIDFAIERAAAGIDLNTIAGQADLVERLAPYLRVLSSDAIREAAAARVAQRVSIPREAILRIAAGKALPGRAIAHGDAPRGEPAETAPERPFDTIERNILKLMVESEEAREYVRNHLEHQWLTDERIEPWIYFLMEYDAPTPSLVALLEAGEEPWPGERRVLSEIMAWDMPNAGARDAEALVLKLHERHRLRVAAELMEAVRTLPPAEADRLLSAIHREHKARLANASGKLRRGRR
jgi:DNA primase